MTIPQADPAAALAAHVARARFEALPSATVAATKRDLLDTLGCALGGSGQPGIAEILRVQRRWGGEGEAGLLLVGGRLPAPDAALLHAAMAHALDYDDTYDRGGSIHPGAAVLGAALAVIELRPQAHGRDVVLAAALGLDVACRIALAATVDRGWHRTAAIGVFGAATAAGKLLGLDASQMHHAFGIALSHAAGSRQCIIDGALTKRLQAGLAARAGVVSALLAAEGFTGGDGVFAGRFGFFPLYQPDGYDLAPLTAELGQAWRGDEVSFKPYPCGRPQHAAIDAAIGLHHQLGLADPARAGSIEQVWITAPAATVADNFAGAPHKRRPTQIVEAQFALPFLLANGLLLGRVGIDEVGRLDDPAVTALAGRLEATASEGSLTITVRLRDGSTARCEAMVPLGAPQNPLTDAQLLAKFHDCAAHAVRGIEPAGLRDVVAVLGELDQADDPRVILRALA